jgi:Protein of unknown function (DUF2846)
MRTIIAVAAVASFLFTAVAQETPEKVQPPTVAVSSGLSPEVDKAQDSTITFFRESHFAGSALKPSVYLDDSEVDRLSNGSWISVHTAPGKHEVKSSAKSEPATVIETKAGEATYVQMVLVTGTWRGAGRLMEVDPAEAQKAIAKLKPLH